MSWSNRRERQGRKDLRQDKTKGHGLTYIYIYLHTRIERPPSPPSALKACRKTKTKSQTRVDTAQSISNLPYRRDPAQERWKRKKENHVKIYSRRVLFYNDSILFRTALVNSFVELVPPMSLVLAFLCSCLDQYRDRLHSYSACLRCASYGMWGEERRRLESGRVEGKRRRGMNWARDGL